MRGTRLTISVVVDIATKQNIEEELRDAVATWATTVLYEPAFVSVATVGVEPIELTGREPVGSRHDPDGCDADRDRKLLGEDD